MENISEGSMKNQKTSKFTSDAHILFGQNYTLKTHFKGQLISKGLFDVIVLTEKQQNSLSILP